MPPRVSILLLNWNGWQDTLECLESLYQITYPNYDVILVDNGSEDESIEKIKEYCEGEIKVESKFFEYSIENKPIKIIEYTREEAEAGGGKEHEIVYLCPNERLILIKNEKNYGFAEGNNIGMRYALKALNPDYVLLLNNDTVVDRQFLGELVKVAEGDPDIGFAGPKVYYYDFNGRKDVISIAGGRLNMWTGQFYRIGIKEVDEGQYDEIKEVDFVEGSALLVRRGLLERVGLLDPSYFAYREENDWCMRGFKARFGTVYVPKAKIWHKGGATAKKISGFAEYLMIRNKFWFMKAHATRRQYLSFLLYFFGFQFWFTSGIHIVYHKNINAFLSFLKGVKDGLKGTHR